MSTLLDSLGSTFFQRALLEAVIVGALAGAVGVHVLLRRLPFFVVAMSHATFPGVVLASIVGVSIFIGGAVFGLVVALAVVLLGATRALDHSSVIGIVLAGAFALGVVLSTATPSPDHDLSSLLVGSILTLRTSDLVVSAVVAVVIATTLALLHKELVFGAFDAEGARAVGYRNSVIDFAMLVIVTVVIVTVIPAVGTLLAVALLTVPALTARLWADRVSTMMVIAAGCGALSGVLGLVMSAMFNIAAGGAIALAATALFALSYALSLTRTASAPQPG